MKKQILIPAAICNLQFVICISLLTANLLLPTISFGQGVGINSTGNAPNSSAMLDIDVSALAANDKKGLLIPRITTTERNAIPSPSAGLMIYNTTTGKINFFNGAYWREIDNTISSSTVAGGTGTGGNAAINDNGVVAGSSSAMLEVSVSAATKKGLLLPRTTTTSIAAPVAGLVIYETTSPADRISFYDGTTWQEPCDAGTTTPAAGSQAQNGIAMNATGASPHQSAILDIDDATKGLLLPRITSAERDALPSPANGLIVYNTTSNRIEYFNGAAWQYLSYTVPAAPTAGTNTPSQTQIIWNWNTVAGATAYYYNTANNFGTATNNGASTSYTQTGLTCAATYTLYIWDSNACGNSTPATTLTQSTSACPSSGGSCGTQIFMTTNMNTGTQVTQATTQAAGQKWCYNDVAANCVTYGGLYQWASAMNLPSTANGALQGGAWQTCDPCGAGGIQGICPAGYHIPTDLEWSRYEYCIESTIVPTGATTLATFQTTKWGRGSMLATAGVYQGPGAKMKATAGAPWADGAASNNLRAPLKTQ